MLIIVTTGFKELAKVKGAIEAQGLNIAGAELVYLPKNTIEITDKETAKKIINLMSALDELDDVIGTYTNFDIADSVEV